MHAFQLVGTEGQIATDGISGKLAVRGNFAPWQGWVLSDNTQSQSDSSIDLMVDYVQHGTPRPPRSRTGGKTWQCASPFTRALAMTASCCCRSVRPSPFAAILV